MSTMAACAVPGVLAIEHLRARASGLDYLVDIHVQAGPELSLRDAHALSGAVKAAVRAAVPNVTAVLVHMEPFERGRGRDLRNPDGSTLESRRLSSDV